MSDHVLVIKEEVDLEREIQRVCQDAFVMGLSVHSVVTQVYMEYDRLIKNWEANKYK